MLSPRRRVLVRDGRELPLIPRYFDLLVFLVERRRDAVHRQEIFDRVWRDVIVSDSALSQAIRTLRRTLGDDPREPRFIRTVSRHGYQFVFEVVEEEDREADREEAVAETPIAELVASRLQQAAGLTPALWAEAALGAGIAGMAAGTVGGLLLTVAPENTAPAAVIPVLAAIGAACGGIAGAGVGAGIAAGEASTRSKRAVALVIGAAFGGFVVGAGVQWLARWTLAALVGVTFQPGGALEGLVIGGAAGLAYALASRTTLARPKSAAIVAAFCGLGACALTVTGHPLVGGTLHSLARDQGALTLTPLARMLGEPDFGPVTQVLIGTGEGAVFGLGLALGLLRRPSSRTSQETLTRS
jgi:DNA-binding winged helix-turn-helix (wHTH) protein